MALVVPAAEVAVGLLVLWVELEELMVEMVLLEQEVLEVPDKVKQLANSVTHQQHYIVLEDKVEEEMELVLAEPHHKLILVMVAEVVLSAEEEMPVLPELL